MKVATFSKDLSDPVPIPESGIKRSVELMRSGRLFRYGEFDGGESEVAQLEREFADYLGASFAVALNSCGCALFVALKCAAVKPGDRVLVNAFTLAPVPGAIEHAGAHPVFVDCGNDYRVDLADLERKAGDGAKVFLMSHMRGHIPDMAAVIDICQRHGIAIIEDCAHTLGASWDGRLSGSFGDISCFSLQSFKHINAGEGGILTTNNEDVAAKAILYSGSYMLYAQNGARPELEVFERHREHIPNFSMRMHEVTAALARPQIELLAARAETWRKLYATLARYLNEIPGVKVPKRPARETSAPSSIQFSLLDFDAPKIGKALAKCRERGVDIKWFGADKPRGFTSTWRDWRYVKAEQDLPGARTLLSTLCDMRIPQTLTPGDCREIAEILADALNA